MKALLLLALALPLLHACEDEFACYDDCDAGTSTSDGGTPPSGFTVAAPLLLDERPISNGLVHARVELRSPFTADAPENLDRGAYLQPPQADLHVNVDMRYTAALLGARAAQEMVPYLRLDLQVLNNDTNRQWTTNLVPLLNLADGLRYGRNISLRETVGLASAGYTLRVTVRRPTWAGDADVEQLSPGVIREPDLQDGLAGTLLGEQATEIRTHFSLDDLENAGGTGGTTSGGGGNNTASSGGNGGYIAP